MSKNHSHDTIIVKRCQAGCSRRLLNTAVEFHGDLLVAAHLLVPQIENSLRYVLESNGVDVTNLKSDGTQPLKVLGAIFGMDATKEIFGEALCFELRGCLIEKPATIFEIQSLTVLSLRQSAIRKPL